MYNPYGTIYRYIKACGDNAPKLQQIMDDNHAIFLRAKGSMHNHQAWEGGYLQHVSDCMDIARYLMNDWDADWPIPFSRASAMLVLFLHDIEKPFMQQRMANDPHMPVWNKAQRTMFRGELIAKYNILLTPEQHNALLYVEGEGDDYSNGSRAMNELGALCHAADVLSARLWHDRNKPAIP